MRAQSTGYRLRMSTLRRVSLTVLLAATAAFFVPGLLAGELGGWWRLVSGVGLAVSLLGLRTVLGPVIVVREAGLRIQRSWPIRRDIPWYRILLVDVIPGFWNLEIELNSGERIALPCVEGVDRLYEQLEQHRSAIDA
ncbi:MAG: hypothetical protein WHS89_06560 [Acidimicrobiales bacterium]